MNPKKVTYSLSIFLIIFGAILYFFDITSADRIYGGRLNDGLYYEINGFGVLVLGLFMLFMSYIFFWDK